MHLENITESLLFTYTCMHMNYLYIYIQNGNQYKLQKNTKHETQNNKPNKMYYR